LTQRQVTVIDLEDLERVDKEYSSLYANYNKNLKGYYANGRITINKKQKLMLLHRFITNVSDPKIKADHKNHDTLNNTKENLRVCTHQENLMNRKSHINTSSEYKGVSWFKRDCKWVAQIMYNNKQIYIGYFTNEIEAAKAYDKKSS
jgi:hypothetical protein